MLVPLSWLKECVDVPFSVTELADRMTLAGLEVEAVQYIGVPGADLVWDPAHFVVARIVEVRHHPAADRLVLAVVDYGTGQLETLVTGAPNLFPYLGQDLGRVDLKSPMVLEGATIYDGHQPGFVKTTLRGRPVRGIMNRHMLCSEKELGISDEHEGILLLETHTAPGTPLQDVLGDAVLDVSLTPNLARCQSILGVAREVAAMTGQSLRCPPSEVLMQGLPASEAVQVEIWDLSLCPRFTATLIRNVTIGPSPQWMQRRLRLVGMRPISNIVDVTNYVMMERGQPLHAFDYDLLLDRARRSGDALPTIVVRAAQPGEGMTSLDGVARLFNPFDILITDSGGPIGIAGVMGGADTEVHDGTQNVLLEAANFDMFHIRRTSQAHRLPSEASVRFGRGIHPAEALRAARRAAELMRTLAGGTVARGTVDVYPGQSEPVVATINPDQVERSLGIRLDAIQIIDLLQALQFECRLVDGVVHATVPDHRVDIGVGLVGTADLAEEIARLYGYQHIPETEMGDRLPPLRANVALEQEERTRDLLVAAGLQEIISTRLTTPESEARILPPGSAPDDRPYLTLANPISQDKTTMRHTLLETMMEAVASNLRHRPYVGLFEIGSVYLSSEEGSLPEEPQRLVLGMAGQREPSGWLGGSGRAGRVLPDEGTLGFFDLKGIIEALTDGWRIRGVRYEPVLNPSFHPGRAARISQTDRGYLGIAGEVHPAVASRFGMPPGVPLLAAELDLDAVLDAIPTRSAVRPVPLFPSVYRDIALVVADDLPAATVQQLIAQTGGQLLADIRLFDLYRGEQLPAGKKSLAYALTFQASDRTLTDEEVNKLRDKIVRRLEREVGAQLRA